MVTNQYGTFPNRGAVCSVEGCDKRVKALDQCSRHYEQMRLNGEHHERPSGTRATPACERVLAKVAHEGDCWIYSGAPNTKRPTVTIRTGFVQMTYQAVYEALVGPVPEGYMLHHSCERPRCVNPAHLVLMTTGEHTRLHRPRLGTGA